MAISALCFFRVSNKYTFSKIFKVGSLSSPERRDKHKEDGYRGDQPPCAKRVKPDGSAAGLTGIPRRELLRAQPVFRDSLRAQRAGRFRPAPILGSAPGSAFDLGAAEHEIRSLCWHNGRCRDVGEALDSPAPARQPGVHGPGTDRCSVRCPGKAYRRRCLSRFAFGHQHVRGLAVKARRVILAPSVVPAQRISASSAGRPSQNSSRRNSFVRQGPVLRLPILDVVGRDRGVRGCRARGS